MRCVTEHMKLSMVSVAHPHNTYSVFGLFHTSTALSVLHSLKLGKRSFVQPTNDLLVEYFNTETIKFQIPVLMCQISDRPRFGPKRSSILHIMSLVVDYSNKGTVPFKHQFPAARLYKIIHFLYCQYSPMIFH